ncbi:MAG: UDP-N-acetylmuramate--L-alanine ligase [Deltaproteobacteria bacterium]|nr:UDP-N-acetylmuramate--L-alanine ligase [Deltaproteobacteria bacterium]
MYRHIRRIHFVGIGGIGMSGIAQVLLNLGYQVSGSDLHPSPLIDQLRRRGGQIRIGHQASYLGAAQVVVTSSAIRKMNPEVHEAIRRGIPVIARAEMLAELMRLKYGVAIAGSHGKTTTTSLIASVLASGGLDPTIVIGGRLKNLRSNARLGKGEFLVAEADESDGSFLHLNPTIAVITNIDPEHMDHYKNFDSLKGTFEEFAKKIPFYGLAVFCADHPVVRDLAKRFEKRSVTYGLNQKADFSADRIRRRGVGSEFSVSLRGKRLGVIRLNAMPGRHNVLNALAAIAVAHELGIPFRSVQRGLSTFGGISRRFEIIREKPVTIMDDYGHHPEEIRATLRTAREVWPKKKLWVLFQPHRYSRTKLLLKEFATAFLEADHLYITEIYAAGEKSIRGVSGKLLAKRVQGRKGHFVPGLSFLAEEVFRKMKRGDVIITLGAGDIWKVGREISKKTDELTHWYHEGRTEKHLSSDPF